MWRRELMNRYNMKQIEGMKFAKIMKKKYIDMHLIGDEYFFFIRLKDLHISSTHPHIVDVPVHNKRLWCRITDDKKTTLTFFFRSIFLSPPFVTAGFFWSPLISYHFWFGIYLLLFEFFGNDEKKWRIYLNAYL